MHDAIVIGGSSGMGLATARLLKEKGLAVLAVSRTAESSAELSNAGIQAKNLDIGNDSDLETFLSANPTRYLIATATPPLLWERLESMTLAQVCIGFEKFWQYLTLTKIAVSQMPNLESLTFVTGALTNKNLPGILMPKIANSAINDMVRTLAVEIAPIRINAVSPGFTDTPFIAEGVENRKQALTKMAADVPLKRVAKAEEIAEVIVLAAMNKNMTGSILDCDGGLKL